MNNRELFFKYIAQTSPLPLGIEITHADGMYLYAPDKKYIDCISGISVCNTGHGNKEILKAIHDQLDRHMHLMVFGEIVQAPQSRLAERLASLLPPELNNVYFVGSGSEAVEGAMKLAKRYTGRHRFVAQRQAYHGSTQGALSLMSEAYYSQSFVPLLPGVSFIDQNDTASIAEYITEDTAAVFIEPVMGEKGYVPCSREYLQAVRNRCNETGALLVLDEIQTAMGRTGEMFAFSSYGIVPDILLLAKSFGGGMPLGAFISTENIMRCLSDKPVLGHITTFGGHPVSCAAALAALEFMLRENLPGDVKRKEQLFRSLLVHPRIKAIDGAGLMLAVDLSDPLFCRRVIDGCVRDGLLIDWFLYAEHKIRLAPPLIIGDSDIREVCGIILENIQKAVQPFEQTAV